MTGDELLKIIQKLADADDKIMDNIEDIVSKWRAQKYWERGNASDRSS